MTATIAQLEKIEFDLVDALAGVPAGELRAKALAVLAKVRAKKRELLALAPDVLRKASAPGRSTPEPRWFGLPSIEPEVTEMVKAARDRQSEERRLAKASGRELEEPDEVLRSALCRPMVGPHALVAFLNRNARR